MARKGDSAAPRKKSAAGKAAAGKPPPPAPAAGEPTPAVAQKDAPQTNDKTKDGGDIIVSTRYVKDWSFENLGAPELLRGPPPQFDIAVEIGGRQSGAQGELVEIVLTITVKAVREERTAFIAEVAYAALCELRTEKVELREHLVFVDVPKLLFPFAARVICDGVRDGGYETLTLSPPDFETMYRERKSSPQSA